MQRNGLKPEAEQKSLEKFNLDYAIKKVTCNDSMQWMEEHAIGVK